jgi:hypothetical protein
MTDHCQVQEAVLVVDPADLDLELAVSERTCSVEPGLETEIDNATYFVVCSPGMRSGRRRA